MLYLTCTAITSVVLAHYGVSHAKDWVSVDCGTRRIICWFSYSTTEKGFCIYMHIFVQYNVTIYFRFTCAKVLEYRNSLMRISI